MTRLKNVGCRIFNFGPVPWKNGLKGLAGQPINPNFGILTFFILEWAEGIFLFYAFLGNVTLRGAGVPAGWPRAKNPQLKFQLFVKKL